MLFKRLPKPKTSEEMREARLKVQHGAMHKSAEYEVLIRATYRETRFRSFCIVDGIVPSNLLFERSNVTRFERFPNSAGSIPWRKLLDIALQTWKHGATQLNQEKEVRITTWRPPSRAPKLARIGFGRNVTLNEATYRC